MHWVLTQSLQNDSKTNSKHHLFQDCVTVSRVYATVAFNFNTEREIVKRESHSLFTTGVQVRHTKMVSKQQKCFFSEGVLVNLAYTASIHCPEANMVILYEFYSELKYKCNKIKIISYIVFFFNPHILLL